MFCQLEVQFWIWSDLKPKFWFLTRILVFFWSIYFYGGFLVLFCFVGFGAWFWAFAWLMIKLTARKWEFGSLCFVLFWLYKVLISDHGFFLGGVDLFLWYFSGFVLFCWVCAWFRESDPQVHVSLYFSRLNISVCAYTLVLTENWWNIYMRVYVI